MNLEYCVENPLRDISVILWTKYTEMHPIIIEATANPKVMKFVADYQLMPGALELDRTSDVSELPLAQELFNFPFVDKIFITANFVAVAKEDTVSWEEVAITLKNTIEDQLLENPRLYRQKKREIFPIYAEMTPNPAVMKFVSQRYILQGFLEAKNVAEATDIPLAKALFENFNFVKEVFISDNFVAVTKDETVQWHEVMVPVRSYIAEYLQAGNTVSNKAPNNHESPVQKILDREYTDAEQKISDVLSEYVAPAVENDGGKISLLEYDATTKTAKMLLQGACSGCPSSTATLKGGIQNVLRQFLPDLVEHVEAVNG